jgi:rhodanese-related sulfurtransferase
MDTRTITRDHIQARLAAGDDVAIVEALPLAHWEDGHLPGAVNLPHDADDATIAVVLPDPGRAVVVYCANEPCANSGILARRLEQLGYGDVAEYPGGKQDWVEAGLALEVPVGR